MIHQRKCLREVIGPALRNPSTQPCRTCFRAPRATSYAHSASIRRFAGRRVASGASATTRSTATSAMARTSPLPRPSWSARPNRGVAMAVAAPAWTNQCEAGHLHITYFCPMAAAVAVVEWADLEVIDLRVYPNVRHRGLRRPIWTISCRR